MAYKEAYASMPRKVKWFRNFADFTYCLGALGLIPGCLLSLGLNVTSDGYPPSAADRTLALATCVVTLVILVSACHQRWQADTDSWKSEQKILSAGGAAGVFIAFTLNGPGNLLGAATAGFLIAFLAGGILLEVPIVWSGRREDEEEKKEARVVHGSLEDSIRENTLALRKLANASAKPRCRIFGRKSDS